MTPLRREEPLYQPPHPSATRAELYVAITRGQTANHIGTVGRQTDPEAHGAEAGHTPPLQQLTAGLARQDHGPTFFEIGPDAPIVARPRRLPVGQLEGALHQTPSSRYRALTARALEVR